MNISNLESIMDNTLTPMSIVEGPDYVYSYANKAFKEMVGTDDVLNRPVDEVYPQRVLKGFVNRLDEVVCSGQAFRAEEVPHVHSKNGITRMFYKSFYFQPVTDSQGTPTAVFIQVDDVTSQVELRKYNEILIQELDHRVRNNIAIILSLIQLQANEIKDHSRLAPFLEAQKRIRVFAKVHELIFSQKDLKNIPMHKLFKRLSNQELNLFNPDQTNVTVDVEELYVNINQAILIGLICNEIVSYVSNKQSCGRKRSVTITTDTSKDPNVSLFITIKNTGKITADEPLLWQDNQFEGKLVNILAMQLKAHIMQCQCSPSSTTVHISFTKADIPGSAASHFVNSEAVVA